MDLFKIHFSFVCKWSFLNRIILVVKQMKQEFFDLAINFAWRQIYMREADSHKIR